MENNHFKRKDVIKFIISAVITRIIVNNWDQIKEIVFK